MSPTVKTEAVGTAAISFAVFSSLSLAQRLMSPAPMKICGGLSVVRAVGLRSRRPGAGPVLSMHVVPATASNSAADPRRRRRKPTVVR